MVLRQAEVIPYCPECKTQFAVHCKHQRTVWVIDDQDPL